MSAWPASTFMAGPEAAEIEPELNDGGAGDALSMNAEDSPVDRPAVVDEQVAANTIGLRKDGGADERGDRAAVLYGQVAAVTLGAP
jgi:hypothetical protein